MTDQSIVTDQTSTHWDVALITLFSPENYLVKYFMLKFIKESKHNINAAAFFSQLLTQVVIDSCCFNLLS